MTTTPDDTALVRQRVERLLAEHDPAADDPVRFLGAQFDAGLAWVHFPEGSGGLGLSPKAHAVAAGMLREAKAPTAAGRNIVGYFMAAPTIVVHGSDEQKTRYLRPLFTGEEIWCQLFSEPGAGSDVAGLSTRAERDGDEWVVNGQKVWTSLAHQARWGLLVARTDPELPKHRGMTYFVVDMEAPGVDVRPLRQMTGEAEFNEVYLSDVRIPDRERLGEQGEGWRVALTTLMNERAGGGVPAARNEGAIGTALRLWNDHGHRDPARRDRLMRLWVEAEVNRLTSMRAAEMGRRGTPGPEGSIGKYVNAELNKRIYELCLELMGPEGMGYSSYELTRPDHMGIGAGGDVRKAFLRSRANSIEGGTSEIMLNILGERVLGLPGEPRVDKDLPWTQVPRN